MKPLPISGPCSFFIPLENIRKPVVFLMFPGGIKENIGLEKVHISRIKVSNILKAKRSSTDCKLLCFLNEAESCIISMEKTRLLHNYGKIANYLYLIILNFRSRCYTISLSTQFPSKGQLPFCERLHLCCSLI